MLCLMARRFLVSLCYILNQINLNATCMYMCVQNACGLDWIGTSNLELALCVGKAPLSGMLLLLFLKA